MKREFLRSFLKFFALSVLIPFAAVLGLGSWSSAEDSSFSVIDSWVEDGFEFHVALESPPSNARCSLHGDGLLEFEVAYYTPASSELESVFGVAIWFMASDPNETVQTYGEVLGPQGLCTKSSPCRIRYVRIVKTWCPPKEGPMYPPGWF